MIWKMKGQVKVTVFGEPLETQKPRAQNLVFTQCHGKKGYLHTDEG